MSRVFASLLIAPVVVLSLAVGLPTATHAQAVGRDGCGRGQQSVPAGAISELPSVTIGIYDGFFLPAQLTVPAGTRVIWVNNGDRPHSTTAWERWDSGVLMPNEGCEAWFVTPGTYDYVSIVAADGGTMTGSITVQGSLPGMSSMPGMMPGGPSMPGTMPGGPSMPGMVPGGPPMPGIPGMMPSAPSTPGTTPSAPTTGGPR